MIEIDLMDLELSRPEPSAKETDVLNWNVGRLCKLILADAERRNADQVRMEPEQTQSETATELGGRLSVLFRIDGTYYTVMVVPRRLGAGVTARFRDWARVGLAGKERPQSGHFIVKVINNRGRSQPSQTNKIVRFLLETLPGPNGETVVVTRRGFPSYGID